jgi:hypothetical protein
MFQFNNGLLDVVVQTNGPGQLALFQFQKVDGHWLLTKYMPIAGYFANAYAPQCCWLGPGKIEIWIPGHRETGSVFEVKGFYVGLKNGKPWPPSEPVTPGISIPVFVPKSVAPVDSHKDP